MRRPKIVVAGYYGCGNIGDDALLLGLLQGLGDRPVDVVVLTGSPEATFRAVGARGIPRREMSVVKKELQTADALVFGGGGLLQDATSLFSLKYYAGLIHSAKRLNKKVILLAQGVGPITSYLGKRAATQAFAESDIITVRDSQSLTLVRSLGYKGRAEVTADLAWLVEPIGESPSPFQGESRGGGAFQLGSMKAVAISARPWGKGKEIAKIFGEFAQLLYKNQYVPVLVEMDRQMDTAILDQIGKIHGGRCPEIRNVLSPADMLGKIRRMHGVVAMRLHAGLFAASAGIAPMMVAYDPKVSAFASQIGTPPAISMQNLSARRLWDSFQGYERDRERLNAIVQKKAEEQRNLAARNIDILLSALPGQ